MARIEVVEPEAATGELKDAYERIAAARGEIANVWKAESLNAAAMEAHLALYMAIMYGPSGLSRRQREMIAMTISNSNRCSYCTTHHSEALLRYLKDDGAIRTIKTDYASAPIGPREKAMLDYAVKVTKTPAAVNDADTSKLREAGFSSADILDITLVASYFNFVNRVVLSLGVELEGDEERVYRY